jgi:hypothetical protein
MFVRKITKTYEALLPAIHFEPDLVVKYQRGVNDEGDLLQIDLLDKS